MNSAPSDNYGSLSNLPNLTTEDKNISRSKIDGQSFIPKDWVYTKNCPQR